MQVDKDGSGTAEEKVHRLLQRAGLEAEMMDPSSMQALQKLMVTPSNPPVDTGNAPRLNHPMSSGVKTPTTSRDGGLEDRILDQLDIQTALLLEMQHRIEELTATVHRLERQVATGTTTPVRTRGDVRTPPPAAARTLGVERAAAPPQEEEEEVVEQPPRLGIATAFWNALVARTERLGNSRFAEMARVFMVLRQRYVTGMDAATLFKIIVVVSILSARMSTRGKENSIVKVYKVFFISTVLVLGFLIKSGYANLFYIFFFKHEYPLRIWRGEEIDLEQEAAALAPPPPPPQQRAADWRNNFLMGGIANPGPQEPGILKIFIDIVYLFGSFFLSIFPMWRPEGNVRPPPPQNEPQQAPQQHPPQQGGIPQVRPPADAAMEAEDDEDDER